ncbi:MAG: glycosyl transferase family 36 [Caldithrix sp.]|nr:glycosyl transferase family 36 [Caldithrix sp.]
MNRYGNFSEDGKEFIIHRPDTPVPWVNYLSNGRYSGLISHTAGGYSFYQYPKDSRITRWRYNSLPVDRPGRYLLLRDQESRQFWSPTWQPTETPLQDFRCRHGLYYTIIESRYTGLDHEVLYFVPSDDLEIWQLTITNNRPQKTTLDIFAFAELALGHALVDLINQPNDQHFNEAFFDHDMQTLFASKRYWVRYSGATVEQANESWDKYVFFSCTEAVKGWDSSKNQFIGRWRSEANPEAVEKGSCFNSEITAGDAIAALQNSITIPAGQTKTIAFLMGVVPREKFKEHAVPIIGAYRSLNKIGAEFKQLKEEWNDYLSHVQVQTPHENMNIMLNVWNQYQTSVTFKFSRDASYHHGGLLFGRGYRDSCQDIMGPVIARPQWVKQRIREMSQYQFSEGSTFHLYHPLSKTGERTGHSDTPLWLPFALTVYLKETADFDFLQESTPFYDEGAGSIVDHVHKAISFVLSQLTDRYLAKFGPGDWNDTLDYLGRKGKGESVWVTMFLAFVLKEMRSLMLHLQNADKAEWYAQEYRKVNQAINEHCWDGKWYIRGTNDEGRVIGSAQNKEGQLFLNTQSWAVISGVAQGERARLCLQAVSEHLDTDKGPKILHPAYTAIDDTIGLATRCVPGKKENGAVFNHPVSWNILAECLMGNAERAFDIYQKALPMNPVIDIDRYEVEPYVYAEYVTSPDHNTSGQASHSWLTGSSTWMLRDGMDYILGIRPDYNGLTIDPCVPQSWREYRVFRKFRGKSYRINVRNPQGVNRGVQCITINDEPVEGNNINLHDAKIQHLIQSAGVVDVYVTMG